MPFLPDTTRLLFALLLTLGPGIPAASAQQQAAGAAPVAAGYMVVESAEVPVRLPLTGRAVAENATRIRPRVGGAITSILFTPGTTVQAGDPLFAIDPLSYETALARAGAETARARADLDAAETAFARADRLRSASATPAAAWEVAELALLKARAALAEAEADARLARAQLDWATVRAPIAGVIGVPAVAPGDLVTPSQTEALAEIVQVTPIFLDLAEPWAARQRIDARAARGEIAPAGPALVLILDDGSRIEGQGRLVATGATLSETTGTRLVRFELANADGRIVPGQFIRAELVLGRQEAILVPQRATERLRDGTLTAWVAANGRAERRKLAEAGSEGNAWIVTAGLAAGDWLLIDGTANLRDGQEIAPVPAVIDAEGVVRDAASGG